MNVASTTNTHAVANVGLGGVVASVGAIGALLSNGDVLLGLYHRDPATIARLVAALFGALFAGVLAYLGRPTTVPAQPERNP